MAEGGRRGVEISRELVILKGRAPYRLLQVVTGCYNLVTGCYRIKVVEDIRVLQVVTGCYNLVTGCYRIKVVEDIQGWVSGEAPLVVENRTN